MMSEKSLSKGLGPERDDKDPATLSEMFDNAFELFNSINKTQEPTNSSKVQVNSAIYKLLFLPADPSRTGHLRVSFHSARNALEGKGKHLICMRCNFRRTFRTHLDSHLVFVVAHHSRT